MCCTYCTVVNFYSCLKLNGGLRKQRKFLILASANPFEVSCSFDFRILKSKFFRLSVVYAHLSLQKGDSSYIKL